MVRLMEPQSEIWMANQMAQLMEGLLGSSLVQLTGVGSEKLMEAPMVMHSD